MNDVEYLKGFSLTDIANKTHLDKTTIKAIINKDFESLLNVNIKMNIKILEREYNVDFTNWLEEFNAYKDSNFKESDGSFRVKPKVVGFEASKKSDKGGFGFFFFLVLITAIAVGGVYYYLEYYEKESANISDSVNLTLKTDELTIEEENQDKKESNETPIVEQNNKTEKIEENENIKTVENTEEEKPSENAIEENKEENIVENSEETEKTEENKETTEEEKADSKPVVKSEHKLFLNPKKKCWVSVKDLKSGLTKNYMLERGVSFDKDSLIFIGNHYYTLELDGKNVKVPGNSNARYILFKDGKVKFLTQAEYTKIDKEK